MDQLHENFSCFGISSKLIDNRWWKLLLNASDIASHGNLSCLDELTEETNYLNINLLSPVQWSEISNFCTRLGLFHISYLIFQKVANEYLSKEFQKKSCFIEKSELNLLALKMHEIKFIKNSFSLTDIIKNRLYFFQARFLLHTLFHETLKYKSYGSSLARSLISNKKVAIVCSKKSLIDNSEEINKFDSVVKFNYTSSFAREDAKLNTNRCDISFYNGSKLSSILEGNQLHIPQSVKLIVVRNKKQFKILTDINEFNERSKLEFPTKSFLGKNLTGLPRALIYLMRYKPSKVKIFNSDLMVTNSRIANYNSSTDDVQDLAANNWLKGAVAHDFILQFKLVEYFLKKSNVEADIQLSNIIQNGLENYSLIMQKNYGIPFSISQKC